MGMHGYGFWVCQTHATLYPFPWCYGYSSTKFLVRWVVIWPCWFTHNTSKLNPDHHHHTTTNHHCEQLLTGWKWGATKMWMTRWWQDGDRTMWWQDDEMARQWQEDKMTRWWDDRRTGQQNNRMMLNVNPSESEWKSDCKTEQRGMEGTQLQLLRSCTLHLLCCSRFQRCGD